MQFQFTITYIIYWVLIGGFCFIGFIKDAINAEKRNTGIYGNCFQKYVTIFLIASLFGIFMAFLFGTILGYVTDTLINIIKAYI